MRAKPNILIVGNFHSHPSAKAFLEKILHIMYPSSNCVVVISGDLPSEYISKIKWIKTSIVSSKSIVSRIPNYLLNQIRVCSIITKMLMKNRLDVVIFLSPPLIPMLFSKFMRIKVIRYQGGSYSKQISPQTKMVNKYLLALLFEKLPYLLADQIIIESISSLKFQNLDKYRSKVVVASLYVDTHLFTCYKKINERKVSVGYIGSLNENKGVDMFSLAITMIGNYLKENNMEILIGGDGPLIDTIINLIEINNLSNNVAFTGWIQHNILPRYLNELKLLVLPSFSEGLPNIMLEAMACGTLVLATPVGAIPDIIIDGKTGFILENNTPECIAQNIIRVLEFPELNEIALNAHKVIENEFSYQAAIKRYENLL